MRRMGDLMREMGFNPDAPESTQRAFQRSRRGRVREKEDQLSSDHKPRRSRDGVAPSHVAPDAGANTRGRSLGTSRGGESNLIVRLV